MKYRIKITNDCNANCSYCFNKDHKKNDFINVKQLKQFLKFNKDITSKKSVHVMGGEPTVHPEFFDIMKMFKKYFHKIYVFTNGINIFNNKKILKEFIKFVEDSRCYPTFNGNIFKLEWVDILLDSKIFSYSVKFVIENKDNSEVFEKIESIIQKNKQIKIIISTDSSLNIFDETIKKEYQKHVYRSFKYLIERFEKHDVKWSYDNSIPYCFTDKDIVNLFNELNILDIFGCLRDYNFGYIDTDFSLALCSGFQEYSSNLFDEKGNPKTHNKVKEILNELHKERIYRLSQSKQCKNCPVIYLCNGSCYSNIILKEKENGNS